MKRKLLIACCLILFIISLALPQNIAANFNKIKKYNLQNILATHTTYFNELDSNRTQNIKVAAKNIDGTIIKAGEIFSFNEVVGARTKKRGFKEAVEIINNQYVTGVGGGVCQVSSTLYNAVLFAGLKIVERKNHSRPVNYIPLGRGATVYYDLIDFKFKNNFSKPMMIIAKVVQDQLTITLLGTDPGINVEVITSSPEIIDPQIIKKTDKKLKRGRKKIVQDGEVGYKVTTRRIIKSGSKIIENSLIAKDIYEPIDKVIKVNPQKN